MGRPNIEITTSVPKTGCPVHCDEYCPQEIIAEEYTGERTLTLEKFKIFLSTVPKDVAVYFAGCSEPFINRDCLEMIQYAHEQGYPTQVYTTLVGLHLWQVKELCKIPFERSVLHLPDSKGIAHIPETENYKECLGYAVFHLPNRDDMNMGGTFETNGIEKVIRGTAPRLHHWRVTCPLLLTPNYQVLPNGNVTFCCATRGIREIIGNLHKNTIPELLEKFPQESERMATDPDSMCHFCSMSQSWWAVKILDFIIGTKKRVGKWIGL